MGHAPLNFWRKLRSRCTAACAEPEVERNLSGYLITSFHNRVRSQLLRDSRLAYEGLLYELEENHQPIAPDWIAAMETKLALELPVSYLTSPNKAHAQLPHFRVLLERDRRLCRNHGRASKIRFYYGVQKAYEALLENQAKRRKNKEPE